jgi:8-oxo-dGTP pyrophosphatase MutT (NUDIX family)
MRLADSVLRRALAPATGEWRSVAGLRDAAVLAPVFEQDGADRLLYTRRRDDLAHHAGEVSFPGGAREGGEDALTCALRECAEEIGLRAESVAILGRLPERTSIAGFRVHVFVGRLAGIDDLVVDPTEVQHLLSIPLAELQRRERWEWREVAHRDRGHRIPFFPNGDDLLWGLTAQFTLDLLERVT